MKGIPRIGATAERQYVVETAHAIEFANAGVPAVLSTPALIGLLERTAREALAEFLEPGETSLGTEIELRHLAPTPVGATVVCRARVVRVERAAIAFQVEARDEHELIARGFHRRHVVEVERFAKRVRAKKKA
jgi:predicted thioesterase